jgi:phosphoribosyl-ATP pyrophosphohydrolase/phosphoribosyl-AMP cyclohydrolase
LYRQILMFSYMNQEALALTLQTGIAHFWNPAKQRVRQQPDMAGQRQRVVDVIADGDGDALIIQVEGFVAASQPHEEVAVHSSWVERETQAGDVSIVNMRSMEIGLMLSELFQLIEQRERERPENSYTAHLFQGGLDLILKKLDEQVTETLIAAKNNAQQKLSGHLADLLYHILVLMVHRGLDLKSILNTLRQRAGLTGQSVPQDLRGA